MPVLFDVINMNEIIKEYTGKSPAITQENANHGFSISGLKNHISSNILKEYTMSLSPAANMHRKGAMHLHDSAGGPWSAYCRGLDLLQIIMEGIKNPVGTSSAPAKHFDVICDHIVNSLYISQNEWEGAQAFSNADTLLAPFVANDGLTQREVEQGIQRMVFNLSYPLRAAFQTPFTNLSFDLTCPEHMRNEPAIIGGLSTEDTYGDFQDEMDMINIAFLDVMLQGDKDGNPHTFPIPTYSITKDFNWNCPVTDKLFELTAKFGLPYFMNYCLVRETPIIKMDDNGQIRRTNLLTIKPGQKIWTPEGFCEVIERHDITVDKTIQFEFSNGAVTSCTPEHQFPTSEGLKEATDIGIDDLIEINNESYDTNNGTFEHGRFLGLYIAEGWNDNKTQIFFPNKDIELINFYENFAKNVFCTHVSSRIRDNGVIGLTVNSKSIIGFINDFIFGNDAKSKRLNNKIFNMSKEFRKGVLVGWLEGDGHLMLDGVSMSRQLIKDMHDLASSIGIQTSMSLPVGNNQSQTKFSNLRILASSHDWLNNSPKGDIGSSKTIFERDDKYYVRVVSKKIDSKEKQVIDIKINNNSRIFTLANGILTHNCGSGLDPSSQRAMCCRLQMDLNAVIEASKGGLWNSGVQTGSLSVVTINLAQLGYLAKTRTETEKEMIEYFYHRLDTLLDIVRLHNVWKREKIIEGFEMGLMPFTKNYLPNFDSFFSTIGVVGGNEMTLNMFGNPIYECNYFVDDVLSYIHKYVRYLTKAYGYPWNLEETPAEGCSHSLALKDRKKYPNIITQGSGDSAFYTNSTHIYVGDNVGLADSLRIQEQFKRHYSGGTLFHIFMGEGSPNPGGIKDLIKNICTKTKLPYMAFTKAYSICPNCGMSDDLSGTCPTCKGETSVFDRVTGFYRPVKSWGSGKQAEFKLRNRFDKDIQDLDLNW